MNKQVICPVCNKKLASGICDWQWSCKDKGTGIDHYMKEIVQNKEVEVIFFDDVTISYEPNITRISGINLRKVFKEKLPYLTSKEALQNFLML